MTDLTAGWRFPIVICHVEDSDIQTIGSLHQKMVFFLDLRSPRRHHNRNRKQYILERVLSNFLLFAPFSNLYVMIQAIPLAISVLKMDGCQNFDCRLHAIYHHFPLLLREIVVRAIRKIWASSACI